MRPRTPRLRSAAYAPLPACRRCRSRPRGLAGFVDQRAANPAAAGRRPADAARRCGRRPAGGRQGAAANRGPRPYDQVITPAAKSERGVLTVHKVDGPLLLRDRQRDARPRLPARQPHRRRAGERRRIPDAPALRSTSAWCAGSSATTRCCCSSISVDAVADDSLPIAQVGGAEQLRADPRGVPDRGVRRATTQTLGHRRHRLLRRRHAGAVGPRRRAAPHVRRAALRSRAQLRQRHPLVPDQRRSAAHADVRRRPSRRATAPAAR